MTVQKLTPKAMAAMQWFYQYGPIGWFDRNAPTDAMRRSLLKRGLIEKLPAQNMQVVKFQLSKEGALALMGRNAGRDVPARTYEAMDAKTQAIALCIAALRARDGGI